VPEPQHSNPVGKQSGRRPGCIRHYQVQSVTAGHVLFLEMLDLIKQTKTLRPRRAPSFEPIAARDSAAPAGFPEHEYCTRRRGNHRVPLSHAFLSSRTAIP